MVALRCTRISNRAQTRAVNGSEEATVLVACAAVSDTDYAAAVVRISDSLVDVATAAPNVSEDIMFVIIETSSKHAIL